MNRSRQLVGGVLGVVSAIFGTWLRIAARDLAWPRTYSFSGPREYTVWAIREQAYQEIGLVFLMFGLAVLILVLAKWMSDHPE